MKKYYSLIVAFFFFSAVSAQIINFPDANFKAKLLAANTGVNIAKDLSGVFCKIDTNNDHEIQVSEAQQIKELNLYFSNISSLEGVSAFTNLQVLNCEHNNLSVLNVQSLSLLTTLNCNINHIDTLNVSGMGALRSLEANSNLMHTINITGTQLIVLMVYNNLLETLDLTGQTELKTLSCSINNLSVLNLNGLAQLLQIDCEFNDLTELDLSGLNNLESLNCSYNGIFELNLAPASHLMELLCEGNLFETLDLSSLNNLLLLYFGSDSLRYLNLKNGIVQDLNTQHCPNLQYVCADPEEMDSVLWIIEAMGANAHANSYCNFTPGGDYASANGQARLDFDNNGCTSADNAVANLKLNLYDTSNTLLMSSISENSGAYTIFLPPGSYTLQPQIETQQYFTVTPNAVTLDTATTPNPFTQDFCFSPNGNHPDLEISIIPLGAARPGFDSQYKIIYKNKGTEPLSGTLNFHYDDVVLDFVSSNSPDVIHVPGILLLEFDDFAPFESGQFIVVFSANSPTETPALNGGDVLDFTASILSGETADEMPDDNTFILHQTVVNSFDPNDKTCLEGATITPEMVGKYVHYLIRFENSGTANAQNIVVKDVIDTSKFEIGSLVPVDGSAPFVTKINDNKVEFIFENINLPFDDANNDGYVAFKIKTNPTLVLGDTFSNTASIYFDYNFPIVTEPAVTTIAVLAKSDFEFDHFFRIYPNPASNILNIDLKQTIQIDSINIYNVLGQLVLVIPNAIETKTVDVSGLPTGNYFIRIYSDKGASNVKFIKSGE